MWLKHSAVVVFAGAVLAGCDQSDAPDDETNPVRPPEISRILPVEEALAGAHIPTVDPAGMNDAEVIKGLGSGPHCQFRYTTSGKPVLALKNVPETGGIAGLLKLNGSLVQLQHAEGEAAKTSTMVLGSGSVRTSLSPLTPEQIAQRATDQREMSLLFEIDTRLKVGYLGYYRCLTAAGPVHGRE